MEQTITVHEVSKLLHIGTDIVRKKCRKRQLPGRKMPGGKDWYFFPSELDIFLRENVQMDKNNKIVRRHSFKNIKSQNIEESESAERG